MFAGYHTNDLVCKRGKILCMARSLGELVKEWREESELSLTELAKLCGTGVKYQNIQQLESGDVQQPKYLAALAKAMGTTVDDLLALKMPPPIGKGAGKARPVSATLTSEKAKAIDVAPNEEAAIARFLAAYRLLPTTEQARLLSDLDAKAAGYKEVLARFNVEPDTEVPATADKTAVIGAVQTTKREQSESRKDAKAEPEKTGGKASTTTSPPNAPAPAPRASR
jgi:transcriptional regulator with XRE-family HTH domain